MNDGVIVGGRVRMKGVIGVGDLVGGIEGVIDEKMMKEWEEVFNEVVGVGMNDLVSDIGWGIDGGEEVKVEFIIDMGEGLELWEGFFGWLLCVVLGKLV